MRSSSKKLGDLTMAERHGLGHFQRRGSAKPFDRGLKRLDEIKTIVRHRHGNVLPQTDDAPMYFEAMARTLAVTFRQSADDQKSYLAEWIEEVAPWANAWAIADGLIIDDMSCPVRPDMQADTLARFLRLTYTERTRLGVTTISACDKSANEMEALRRERDTERKRTKRLAAGMRPQSQSVSRAKPWLDAGFKTRSGWERWKRRNQQSLLGNLAQDLARPPSIAEQDLARPSETASKGRAETLSEGSEQTLSAPIIDNTGSYLSGSVIGRATFCVRSEEALRTSVRERINHLRQTGKSQWCELDLQGIADHCGVSFALVASTFHDLRGEAERIRLALLEAMEDDEEIILDDEFDYFIIGDE